MAHSLIVGMTESGKSTLGKQLSKLHKSAGFGILVLDPMNDPGWSADYKTDDNDAFLMRVWDSERCHVFVDEAGDAIGRYDATMQQLATKSRHWGHSCYFLTQRAAQLAFTVRAQCRHVFVFTSAKEDCKILAAEFNKPELLQANDLPQGEFFHAQRYGPVERGKLW